MRPAAASTQLPDNPRPPQLPLHLRPQEAQLPPQLPHCKSSFRPMIRSPSPSQRPPSPVQPPSLTNPLVNPWRAEQQMGSRQQFPPPPTGGVRVGQNNQVLLQQLQDPLSRQQMPTPSRAEWGRAQVDSIRSQGPVALQPAQSARPSAVCWVGAYSPPPQCGSA